MFWKLWSTWSPVSRVLMSHASARCETRCNLTFFMSVPGISSYTWSPLHYWLCSDFIWLFILHRNSVMQGEGIWWLRHAGSLLTPYLMRNVDGGCLLHVLLMITLYNLSYVSPASSGRRGYPGHLYIDSVRMDHPAFTSLLFNLQIKTCR